MKKCVYALVSLIIISLVTLHSALATEKQVLTKDTTYPICGKSQSVTFAAGTKVYLNENKEVQKGTLVKDTALRVPGVTAKVVFRKNTQVEFSWLGLVKQGTLAQDTMVSIEGSRKPLKCKGDCVVIFGDGGLLCGTLAEKTTLPNPRNKSIPEEYPVGTYVMFTIIGQIYYIGPGR